MAEEVPSDSDADSTVIIPTPGRRKSPLGTATSAPAAAAGATGHLPPIDLAALAGLNPIVAAANQLLAAAPRIRSTVAHPDPAGLRETMLRQIGQFEEAARKSSVGADRVTIAKYALSTLIDESALQTPWGGTAQWAQNSLLVSLFRENWGGEKFFQLLNKMAEDPATNVDLLELFYVCIALGFEGRFRVIDNGRAQLEQVREKLYELIRRTRGDVEAELSPHWRGEVTKIKPIGTWMPLWVSTAVAAILLLGAYVWFSYSLNGVSDAIAFSSIRTPKAVPVKAAPPPPPVAPRISKFLEAEIKQGLVEVREDAQISLVSIRGDGLFDPGQATLRANYASIIERIAEELNRFPGPVVVTGHSDNQPIRTARFPSNWHLSQERAQSVMTQMQGKLKDSTRLKAEGMADAYPLAGNDTVDGRARNRRVEIMLKMVAQ